MPAGICNDSEFLRSQRCNPFANIALEGIVGLSSQIEDYQSAGNFRMLYKAKSEQMNNIQVNSGLLLTW